MEKKQQKEFFALGIKLYIRGIQLEKAKNKMESLLLEGYTLSSPEMLQANEEANRLGIEFERMERRFCILRKKFK